MPGASPRGARGRCPARAALVVGLAALGADGVEVEQVGGRLRHEPDVPRRRHRRRGRGGRRRRGAVGAVARDRAGPQRPGALQRPQQRGLARAVAAHERGDLAAAQVEVDPGARRRRRRGVTTTSRASSEDGPAVPRPGVVRAAAVASRRAPAAAAARGGRRAPRAAAATTRPSGRARRPGERRRRCAMTSAGSPCATTPSAPTWTTVSAYWRTRSIRCSATTTVTARSWTSRVIVARTSSAPVGSSAEVGSSRTMTGGGR